jgi:glycosyltransferase involved in cell wall biosynthesis
VGNFAENENSFQKPIAVTALMPVKNGMDHIFSSMRQLSNTCRKFDEVLVVDDNSKDGTLPILQRWAAEDQRVRVLSNPGEGLVSALNLGINEASNNWIARFDVDDIYSKDRLDQQVTVAVDQTIAIFSDYEFWTPNGNSLGKVPGPVDSDAVSISLVNSRRTPHPSVLYSRDAVLAVGGYRAEDFPAEDLSLWLRMSKIGKLVSIPQVLLNYQLRSNSVSGQHRALILKKTSELQCQIGTYRDLLKSGFERADTILESYEGLELAKERQILFLQELIKAFELAGDKKRGVLLGKLLRKMNLDMCKALIDISTGTAKRRVYRKFG